MITVYYADENLLTRLEKNRYKTHVPKKMNREVRLFTEMSVYIFTENKAGFDRWAKLNNLKEAAWTFNYLSEHNLLNYENLKNHISNTDTAIHAAASRIQQLGNDLNIHRLLQKRCNTYRHC